MEPFDTGLDLVELEQEMDAAEYISELQTKLETYSLDLGVDVNELFE